MKHISNTESYLNLLTCIGLQECVDQEIITNKQMDEIRLLYGIGTGELQKSVKEISILENTSVVNKIKYSLRNIRKKLRKIKYFQELCSLLTNNNLDTEKYYG